MKKLCSLFLVLTLLLSLAVPTFGAESKKPPLLVEDTLGVSYGDVGPHTFRLPQEILDLFWTTNFQVSEKEDNAGIIASVEPTSCEFTLTSGLTGADNGDSDSTVDQAIILVDFVPDEYESITYELTVHLTENDPPTAKLQYDFTEENPLTLYTGNTFGQPCAHSCLRHGVCKRQPLLCDHLR